MANRLRMVVASFLQGSGHRLAPWGAPFRRLPERPTRRQQWRLAMGGVHGLRRATYFRIFNPSASRSASIPTAASSATTYRSSPLRIVTSARLAHESAEQAAAGFVLGRDHPAPWSTMPQPGAPGSAIEASDPTLSLGVAADQAQELVSS